MPKAVTLKGALRIKVMFAAVDVLLFIKSSDVPFYVRTRYFVIKGIYIITLQK